MALLAWFPALAWGQPENLLDRINSNRMAAFEEQLTATISAAIARYVSPSRFVLSVKVIFNRDIIPAIQAPGLGPARQKLPGFPIFVSPPGRSAEEESAPPFVRLVVKLLLDETLPEYYERFLRKIVPIVARFDPPRGDQVIILKETFPVKPQEAPPPTLPEKELLQQLGETLPQLPPQVPPPPPAAVPRPNVLQEAQIAYEEGRLTDALRIVQTAFSQATTNQARAMYLGMEGSVSYTMGNPKAALASWRRALVFDPTNLEIQRVTHFLEQRISKEGQ
ncbi:MAG: hypothetical protein IIA14_09885 [SAR324 cluster bacterium]|nr:hypothetical protein [SAR324 cluster bacterium]